MPEKLEPILEIVEIRNDRNRHFTRINPVRGSSQDSRVASSDSCDDRWKVQGFGRGGERVGVRLGGRVRGRCKSVTPLTPVHETGETQDKEEDSTGGLRVESVSAY